MDECQSGAPYSQTGRMKVVQMRSRSSWDALKDFNFDIMKNVFPRFEIILLVLSNHYRSSVITIPNRFTFEARAHSYDCLRASCKKILPCPGLCVMSSTNLYIFMCGLLASIRSISKSSREIPGKSFF